MPSSVLTERCISATSSSAVSAVGSIGGRSSPRTSMTCCTSSVVGEGAEVAQGGHLGRDVAVGRADQQPEERQALGLAQAPRDAEVQQRRLPRRQHEEVAAVQVPVEDPVEQGPLEEADHAGAHHRLGVDAGGLHPLHVAEVEAVEALHHEHPPRHQRGVGPGDDEVALLQRGEGRRHIEHVLGLEPEVELLDDRLGEELDEGGRVGQRGDGDPAHQVRGQPGHDGEVLAHPVRHRRALDLDHHRRPVAQRRRVHLRDGGRGERRLLDRGEDGAEGAAQLLGEHLLDDRPRLGGHLVAAPLELGHQLGREDAVTRRDDLAQLDVGGAQPLGRHPQPPRNPGEGRRAATPALAQVPQPERAADVAQRRAQAPDRRQGAALGEAGERGGEAGAHAGQPGAPGQLVRDRWSRARCR